MENPSTDLAERFHSNTGYPFDHKAIKVVFLVTLTWSFWITLSEEVCWKPKMIISGMVGDARRTECFLGSLL